MAAAQVVDVEVLSSELLGAGGFVQLRRLQVRNLRVDGTSSPAYLLDAVERPAGADAVVVLAYQRTGAGIRVLLHRGLRPATRLGRGGEPTREGAPPPILLIEAVAGILEAGDQGEVGLRQRAVRELAEEVGLSVAADDVKPLGPPIFLSFGVMAERLYFCRVEAALEGRGQRIGDGSHLEEGGAALSLELGEALARCRRGEIQDAKTEIALRRLAELLTDEGR